MDLNYVASLPRALYHVDVAGFAAETDGGGPLPDLLFRSRRPWLEYHVKAGNANRVGFLMDRGGVYVTVRARSRQLAPRWKRALYMRPPVVDSSRWTGTTRSCAPSGLRDPCLRAAVRALMIEQASALLVGGEPPGLCLGWLWATH